MQKNKTVALCVASLLVLASVPLYTSHAFPSENVNAWKLIEIAQDAYEQVEYIVEQARFRGENVTLAELLIDQGRGLLIQARNNHTVGDYRLALENAKMAQLRFREALQVCTYDEAENECEVGCGLLVAIGQARERIQRLRDIVAGLEIDEGEEEYVNWVNGNLTEAGNNLDTAEALIKSNPCNASEAARLLGEANRDINEAHVALRFIGDLRIARRVENFARGLRNQIGKAREELEDAKDRGRNVKELEEILEHVEEFVENARNDIAKGRKDDALEEAKRARDLLHDALNELKKTNKGRNNK